MTTAQQPTASRFLKTCRNTGTRVWIGYGTNSATEITGYVLRVTKHTAEVQDAYTGEIHNLALYAIEEAVEAA